MPPSPLVNPDPPGLGTWAWLQPDPSQCIISVCSMPLLLGTAPAAHTLFADTAAIPDICARAGAGRSRGAQALPSQWYSTGTEEPPKVEPSAQTSLPLAPLTAENT